MTLYQKYYGRVFKQSSQWKISVQHNGVRKTFYSSLEGDMGRKDCAKKVVAWISAGAAPTSNKRLTVNDVYTAFLKDKALETSDIYNIENRYKNHIKPIIGQLKLENLTVQDFKRVIATAYNECNLSRKSLLNLRGDLSLFCGYLYDSNLRTDLSTTRVKIPRSAKRGTKEILATRDVYLLFTHDMTLYNNEEVKDYYIYAYRFQVLYGLRPGELIGLQWDDVDEENATITIRRSINAKGKQTDGKNDFAQRVLPLSKLAKQLLEAQNREYRTDPKDPTERIFGDYGSICYRKRWGIYCMYNGLQYVTPYELRHTFASNNKLLETWILDEVMGHAHEGMSLGVYAHACEGDMDGVTDRIDGNLLKQIDRGQKHIQKSNKKA